MLKPSNKKGDVIPPVQNEFKNSIHPEERAQVIEPLQLWIIPKFLERRSQSLIRLMSLLSIKHNMYLNHCSAALQVQIVEGKIQGRYRSFKSAISISDINICEAG